MDYPQKLAQLLSRRPTFDWDATNRATQYQAMADGAPVGAVGAAGGVVPFQTPTDAPTSFQDAMGAASFFPGVGDAAGLMGDAAMYATDPASRTPGNYALSAAGLLPFVPAASVTEKMAGSLRSMAKEWDFLSLPRRERAEEIRRLADELGEKFKGQGFNVSVEHSGSAAGPSSYLTVQDPQTGRALQNQIRISDHGKGAFQNQFVTNLYGPEDADKIFEQSLKMRELGPTDNFLAAQEKNRLKQQELIQIRLNNARKKMRVGRPLSNAEQEAVDQYGLD